MFQTSLRALLIRGRIFSHAGHELVPSYARGYGKTTENLVLSWERARAHHE
jgi:hypothetical protein